MINNKITTWLKTNIDYKDIRVGDIVILLLSLFFVAFLVNKFWLSNDASVYFVQVQIENQPIKLYPSLLSQKIKIDTENGAVVIEIKQGKARFYHSDCYTQQCVLHGWIDKSGESISCLPNKVSILMQGTSHQYDALSF